MATRRDPLATTPETREFVRGELAWLARLLIREHGLSAHDARRVLREALDRAV